MFAQSYECKLKQNGYAHALNALGGSQNQKLEYAKAWMPEQFTVNANYLEFYNFEPLEITGKIEKVTFKLISILQNTELAIKYISTNILVQEKYTFHRKTIRELDLLCILAFNQYINFRNKNKSKPSCD